MYCTVCIVRYVFYGMYCTVCIVRYVLYGMYFTVCIVRYALYGMYCTVCILRYVFYGMYCTVCISENNRKIAARSRLNTNHVVDSSITRVRPQSDLSFDVLR
jgi:D-alanyl-lipoteichoic acid acyltransferase DltB (MBOAT superfamily)